MTFEEKQRPPLGTYFSLMEPKFSNGTQSEADDDEKINK